MTFVRTTDFSVLLLCLILSACATEQGLHQISGDDPKGCIGAIPVAALRERKIDVELAQTAIQAVTLGKLQTKYEDTVEVILDDKALNQWVKKEMECQAQKAFTTERGRVWFLQMKEVSDKATGSQLIQWLKEYPPPATRQAGASVTTGTDDARPTSVTTLMQSYLEQARRSHRYGEVYGDVTVPYDAIMARVRYIGFTGNLYVPGPTSVEIFSCDGDVFHHKQARIVIKNSSWSCSQLPLPPE